MFLYVALPSIHSLHPHRGPDHGGTIVSVFGESFSWRAHRLSLLSCSFNSTFLLASMRTDELVECISPRSPPGTLSVRISNTPPSLSTRTLFFEIDRIRIDSVIPSTGPTEGGTVLSIVGKLSLFF